MFALKNRRNINKHWFKTSKCHGTELCGVFFCWSYWLTVQMYLITHRAILPELQWCSLGGTLQTSSVFLDDICFCHLTSSNKQKKIKVVQNINNTAYLIYQYRCKMIFRQRIANSEYYNYFLIEHISLSVHIPKRMFALKISTNRLFPPAYCR